MGAVKTVALLKRIILRYERAALEGLQCVHF